MFKVLCKWIVILLLFCHKSTVIQCYWKYRNIYVMFFNLGFNPSKQGCPLIVLDEANTKFVVNWTLRKLLPSICKTCALCT